MFFKDRADAGRLLAIALEKFKDGNCVVYALPRGGVVTAYEIAKYLRCPLDLIITRKIGHPSQPEYAIAATAENGHIVGSEKEMSAIDEEWLKAAIEKERKEAGRRREKYLQGRKEVPAKGKIAILVDDGIATGLTMRVAIKELKHRQPKKIIVATPVVPKDTAKVLRKEVDELIALEEPREFYAIGEWYENFPQVTDDEVTQLMEKVYEKNFYSD
ncbi:MAG: hypothetical protein A3D74_05525 [Candidatus Levybacteria bacterium RIFCSPHIGHO2_02_FULL_37_13]|nr:MAG: hypothetical protein A3D74_05525 [Candidatus Levybacteria bacterium RIFCSPHIGHO2_02_FULL_37_13]OGH29126.1 MAG: hypothetical protein A3E40_03205 [Candidatus Levybacteria bacterium RIFCSPHIGHO2_12_FULL_37_9]OGH40404.1 MAG: hypothetical protein A3B41_02750 [Candidatus Levybacteria bacterium RIFCSPLOWO2_01_FULL_37_26]